MPKYHFATPGGKFFASMVGSLPSITGSFPHRYAWCTDKDQREGVTAEARLAAWREALGAAGATLEIVYEP